MLTFMESYRTFIPEKRYWFLRFEISLSLRNSLRIAFSQELLALESNRTTAAVVLRRRIPKPLSQYAVYDSSSSRTIKSGVRPWNVEKGRESRWCRRCWNRTRRFTPIPSTLVKWQKYSSLPEVTRCGEHVCLPTHTHTYTLPRTIDFERV